MCIVVDRDDELQYHGLVCFPFVVIVCIVVVNSLSNDCYCVLRAFDLIFNQSKKKTISRWKSERERERKKTVAIKIKQEV